MERDQNFFPSISEYLLQNKILFYLKIALPNYQ